MAARPAHAATAAAVAAMVECRPHSSPAPRGRRTKRPVAAVVPRARPGRMQRLDGAPQPAGPKRHRHRRAHGATCPGAPLRSTVRNSVKPCQRRQTRVQDSARRPSHSTRCCQVVCGAACETPAMQGTGEGPGNAKGEASTKPCGVRLGPVQHPGRLWWGRRKGTARSGQKGDAILPREEPCRKPGAVQCIERRRGAGATTLKAKHGGKGNAHNQVKSAKCSGGSAAPRPRKHVKLPRGPCNEGESRPAKAKAPPA